MKSGQRDKREIRALDVTETMRGGLERVNSERKTWSKAPPGLNVYDFMNVSNPLKLRNSVTYCIFEKTNFLVNFSVSPKTIKK